MKFNNEIDKLITQIPAIGKESEKRILKTIRDFFEVLPKIIKENGTITCIGLNIQKIIDIAKQNNFKIKHERKIMQGKETLILYVFEKNK